ncbi:PREDICTED: uncharacterized protein LOC109465198 [Branchiostoma belcheri]|uniref:Uncharacterized protein LOC109465198 n=1 Tax=Branchiostoma belcheri TaxID=7741 RepID=A0A6P4Y6D2_BRABE|nr:PREDICTED: uncharacterized protein LOC109465198 [Branchiostoma belcheri]
MRMNNRRRLIHRPCRHAAPLPCAREQVDGTSVPRRRGVTSRQSATHRPNLRTTAGVAERGTPGPRTTEAAVRGTTTPLTRVRQPACCTPALKVGKTKAAFADNRN